MRIDIITVLPEMLESFFNCSIMSRAQKKGIAEIHIHNLRDYAYDRYRKVDDYPFAFLDAAIPDSQELVLFATELTANWFTSWFIQNFAFYLQAGHTFPMSVRKCMSWKEMGLQAA